jgi:hypothetical protein
MEVDRYCEALRERIEGAYLTSGNSLGWRLLASPASVLEGAEIAFLGLNPGGSTRPKDHSELSMECGSAYVRERWGNGLPGESPLQKQVRALFKRLGIEPDRVIAGNLVPFRSPSWADLNNREASLRFGEQLWGEILDRARPRLVIGMGRETYVSLCRILGATAAQSVPVGWGNVAATRAVFKGGLLIGLPHLSRFGIVTRAKSEAALQELFGDDWSS